MATSGQWRAQRSGFLSKKDGTAPRRLELLARGAAGSQPMPRGRVFLARRSASRQPRHSLQTMTFTALLARLPRHCPAPLNRGFAHETEGLREVTGVQGNELRGLAELEPRKVACRRAARHSGRRWILGGPSARCLPPPSPKARKPRQRRASRAVLRSSSPGARAAKSGRLKQQVTAL